MVRRGARRSAGALARLAWLARRADARSHATDSSLIQEFRVVAKCKGQMKINNVIIVINPSKSHAQQTAVALKTFFEREKVRQEWVETFPPQKSLYRKMADLRGRKVDLVIAVGGDGTLLQAAHRFRGSGVPILGINIGYLGFITSIRSDRVRQEMKRVLNAEFIISRRTALDLEIRTGRKHLGGWALNDALITRGGNPHLIGIEARIGQRRLT